MIWNDVDELKKLLEYEAYTPIADLDSQYNVGWARGRAQLATYLLNRFFKPVDTNNAKTS